MNMALFPAKLFIHSLSLADNIALGGIICTHVRTGKQPCGRAYIQDISPVLLHKILGIELEKGVHRLYVYVYHLQLLAERCFGKVTENAEACIVYKDIGVIFFSLCIKVNAVFGAGKVCGDNCASVLANLISQLVEGIFIPA